MKYFYINHKYLQDLIMEDKHLKLFASQEDALIFKNNLIDADNWELRFYEAKELAKTNECILIVFTRSTSKSSRISR